MSHTHLSQVQPLWHSSQGRFAHNHPKCPIARYVAPRQRIEGSGGRPLCRECERLVRDLALTASTSDR